MKQIIHVDAGFSNGEGRIAWFNETTGKSSFKRSKCRDNYRCEYAAVVEALGQARGINAGDELEVRTDSEVIVKQLNRESAINEDDIRKIASKLWEWGQKRNVKVTFVRIPRKENKAGKLLGS